MICQKTRRASPGSMLNWVEWSEPRSGSPCGVSGRGAGPILGLEELPVNGNLVERLCAIVRAFCWPVVPHQVPQTGHLYGMRGVPERTWTQNSITSREPEWRKDSSVRGEEGASQEDLRLWRATACGRIATSEVATGEFRLRGRSRYNRDDGLATWRVSVKRVTSPAG